MARFLVPKLNLSVGSIIERFENFQVWSHFRKGTFALERSENGFTVVVIGKSAFIFTYLNSQYVSFTRK